MTPEEIANLVFFNARVKEIRDLVDAEYDIRVKAAAEIERLAFEIPAPNPITPQFIQIAIALRVRGKG